MLTAPYTLEWVEEPLPRLGPRDVLVHTSAGAVSIGTELPLFRGAARGHEASYPRMTGYESLATIVGCGVSVKDVQIGDRVVAFYGHRTAAVVRRDRVVAVPPDISDQAALLMILACDSAKGVSKVDPQPDERVLITGAGTMGLLTLFNLRAHGVEHVDIVDPEPERRELARELGAYTVCDPSQPLPADGYQIAFECSGRDSAFALLQRGLQPGERLCVLSDGNIEPLTLTPDFHRKELLLVGSSNGLDYAAYAQWFWNQVRMIDAPIEQLFELVIDAPELREVFAALNDTTPPIKVLVRYTPPEPPATDH